MPHVVAKLHSRSLSSEETRRALRSLPRVLAELVGETIVSARYGWGSSLHADLQYVPMRLTTAALERFVEDSLAQEIVVPGSSDFCFVVGERRLEILFCHEGDIHLDGDDPLLIERLQKSGYFAEIEFNPGIRARREGERDRRK
ncbi:MAG TPA: hypothetical protein VNL14_14625 [Candidatus Acidoferrales bacterium]|nr:hypothetical protein [Candidatus Acidoferrales bacterium]